jgi:hypothetical protein
MRAVEASQEVRGTMRIVVQKGYKKPGESELCTWYKTVTIHTAHSVTLEQAQQILKEWQSVNEDCMGSFGAAVY